jgi:hypothetical protein
VTATTTTTIRGVSIFSRQRTRKTDVFDITLSPEGIAIRRPGRVDQHMTWDRITGWELAERQGCVVLTVRGDGSVTPLMVQGWTLDDLETVMREATVDTTGPAAAVGPEAVPTETVPTETVPTETVPTETVPTETVPTQTVPTETVPAPAVPVVPRAARRRAGRRSWRRVWKPLVVIVLLGILATAVALVLLQSAGIISWGFLGPTA